MNTVSVVIEIRHGERAIWKSEPRPYSIQRTGMFFVNIVTTTDSITEISEPGVYDFDILFDGNLVHSEHLEIK